jgi:hypothetical protein
MSGNFSTRLASQFGQAAQLSLGSLESLESLALITQKSELKSQN